MIVFLGVILMYCIIKKFVRLNVLEIYFPTLFRLSEVSEIFVPAFPVVRMSRNILCRHFPDCKSLRIICADSFPSGNVMEIYFSIVFQLSEVSEIFVPTFPVVRTSKNHLFRHILFQKGSKTMPFSVNSMI